LLAQDLAAHIAWLDGAVRRIEQAIAGLVRTTPELAKTEALLRSAPGIGPVKAAVLISQLPELGQTSAGAIAALAGLAPYNNDKRHLPRQTICARRQNPDQAGPLQGCPCFDTRLIPTRRVPRPTA